MAFYLTQAQVNVLQYLDPTWAENYYANLYDLICEFIQSPDPFGTSADDNVIAWFGAAKDANRGVGGDVLDRICTFAGMEPMPWQND